MFWLDFAWVNHVTKLPINHIILLAKYYIHNRKLNIIHPSLKVFIAKVEATCQIELKIAATGNKLVKHY